MLHFLKNLLLVVNCGAAKKCIFTWVFIELLGNIAKFHELTNKLTTKPHLHNYFACDIGCLPSVT